MAEKTYGFSITDQGKIERIISDENVDLNHIVLTEGEALPEHFSNSNVYLIIIRGTIKIGLNGEKAKIYRKGSILSIPYNTKMIISNSDKDVLEFFIVKSPSPKSFEN